MCGIIGYYGLKNGAEIVVQGLKKLEYRGYDSWGIAIKEKGGFNLIKKVGKISDTTTIKFDKSNIAIGHTRWSTHGAVTEENAHPHLSNNGQIAVVHNGIIENYQTLKKMLLKNNFKFKSGTDTEVIPVLIEHFMKQHTFEDACKLALNELKGSYAVVILNKNSDGLIAARKGSPLVIGVGKDEFFVASDIPAFLEYTKKVIYLEDYDVVEINKEILIYNLKEQLYVNRPIKSIEWDAEQAKKGEFEHFMLKEIIEQTHILERAISQEKENIQTIADLIKKSDYIILIACGSSYHACMCAKYILSNVAKKHVDVVLASEFPNQAHFLNENSLIIAVSQYGETADVL